MNDMDPENTTGKKLLKSSPVTKKGTHIKPECFIRKTS